MAVGQSGFRDVVIWNPGAEKAGQLPDMQAGEERSFICIEAGAIMEPIRLGPGEEWTGKQQLTVMSG